MDKGLRLAFLAIVLASAAQPHLGATANPAGNGPNPLYLPVLAKVFVSADNVPLINVPYFNVPNVLVGSGKFDEMAVFWFGRVTVTENYADVRLGYNDRALYVAVSSFDRLLWFDTTPAAADLTAYDAVSLFLETSGARGSGPAATSFRFIGQASRNPGPRTAWQLVQQGNGAGWVNVSVPFTTTAAWWSTFSDFNDAGDDVAWALAYEIPFASLGLPARPTDGSQWQLAVTLHDKDYAASVNPAKVWPPFMHPDQPALWGRIRFGLPAFSPPAVTAPSTTTVRHGVNGVIVNDGSVGGWATCGQGLDPWRQWGDTVYDNPIFNGTSVVQNQRNTSDWPCFSKYYVTFPLATIPRGMTISSATLTLYQTGGSGSAGPDPCPGPGGVTEPQESLIQVFRVDADWNPATLSWNNAPLALENVSQAWVDPHPAAVPWPGIRWTWDLSQAVTMAYQKGQPLRLALYSADGACYSGKYFASSDVDSYLVTSRPKLDVVWGTP